MVSILIKNGELIYPEDGVKRRENIAIEDNKIVAIGNCDEIEAQFVVDAEGCIVTPGLIDGHAHLFPLMRNGIPAEAICFASGVTGIVDAGSTGCANYRQVRGFLENSYLTTKCWLHVCSTGLSSLPALENVNPADFNKKEIEKVFEEYGNQLLGLKLRTSRNIVKELGYTPMKETIKLAEELNVPVMVHCTGPPGPMEELLDMLRPGDILTHMYQNTGYTILNENKHVSKAAIEARKRGVLFEAADARYHFSFEVSEAAIAEGFYPDFISTDLTKLSMFQRPTAFSLAMQINKYINLGIPMETVIRCCTVNTAKLMKLYPKIGTLVVGSNADIAVFLKENIATIFGDRPAYEAEKALREGKIFLKPVMTIKDGHIVYRDMTI